MEKNKKNKRILCGVFACHIIFKCKLRAFTIHVHGEIFLIGNARIKWRILSFKLTGSTLRGVPMHPTKKYVFCIKQWKLMSKVHQQFLSRGGLALCVYN